MNKHYSENWRDYIIVSLISGCALGAFFGLLASVFVPEMIWENLLFFSVSGMVLISPFVPLSGFPVLKWAKKLARWKRIGVFLMVGYLWSNSIYVFTLLTIMHSLPNLGSDIEWSDFPSLLISSLLPSLFIGLLGAIIGLLFLFLAPKRPA